ncbi:MAG: VirK/YbjX family protein [Hafnia sp.]|uniref:VirK/YbjX family protein n=1 Tax=Hafnia sp. TaxID=1873498 RepID=UPI002FC9FD40
MSQISVERTADKSATGFQLFNSLAKGELRPGRLWHARNYRTKFVLRTFLAPIATMKLLNNIAAIPSCQDVLLTQPRLPCKLHHPYLNVHFKRRDTVKAIGEHYQMLDEALPNSVLRKIYRAQPYYLCEIEGKNEQLYRIGISPIDSLNKEGELSLLFYTAEGVMLSECTFTLLMHSGKKTLFIGGLQGPKQSVPHELIQTATKGCHGLFPKRLLMQALCLFAHTVGCEQILAVGNETHIYKNWRYNKKKSRKMMSDYDAFWLSIGAVSTAEGYFSLPMTIERKSLEEIASKKRAEYRRRYQLLDTLESSARVALGR